MTDSTASPSRAARRWPWLLVLAALAGGGLYWHHAPHAASSHHGSFGMAGPTPVQVAAVRRGAFNVWIDAPGTITPANTAVVHSRVDGQLLRLDFQEGQTVRAGALLAELDPRPFQVQLKQALGQLARDAATLADARLDLARYRTLLAQDSIARQQVDTQASLVRQTAGAVKADQALVDSARLQLSYTRITAPIDGRLGLRQVDVGNMIHATDPNGIVTLTQMQPACVVFSIPGNALDPVLAAWRAGQRLRVEAWNRNQDARIASGKLTAIDNQIDPTTGTVRLKATFTSGADALFPNQFVNVRLLAATLQNATLVPATAIQTGSDGPYAFVVRPDGKAALQHVQIGASDGNTTVVRAGLQPGETVVVDGLDRLRNGMPVKAVADPAAAKKARR